jgi:hypothetical protein
LQERKKERKGEKERMETSGRDSLFTSSFLFSLLAVKFLSFSFTFPFEEEEHSSLKVVDVHDVVCFELLLRVDSAGKSDKRKSKTYVRQKEKKIMFFTDTITFFYLYQVLGRFNFFLLFDIFKF